VIGSAGDGYRVVIGNQILLIPAVAVVLAALRARAPSWARWWRSPCCSPRPWISHTRGHLAGTQREWRS